jgi:hypothetical protein
MKPDFGFPESGFAFSKTVFPFKRRPKSRLCFFNG